MSELTGGCLCSSIRYRVVAPAKSISVCHCLNCRKQSGSHRSLNWLLPEEALIVEGELTTFKDTGDSGKAVLRQFCGKCGSPIKTVAEILPGLVVLKAGTLDLQPTDAPNYALYSVNAAPWELNGLSCPIFDGMPIQPKSDQ